MARTLVVVNPQGRITLPADMRKKLRLASGSQLEVGVEGDRITLRPARVVPAEDAWAYGREELAGIRRALEDVKAGRVYRLGAAELVRIAGTGKLPRQAGSDLRTRKAGQRKSA